MSNLETFRNKLLSLKDEISHRLNAIDKDVSHKVSADWAEQATERENDEVLDSLGNISEKEITMINQALKRIDSGDYFICSTCGADIPVSRLEFIPYSTLCIDCAQKLES